MHPPCEFGDFNFIQSVLGTSATLTTGSFNVGVTLESSCSGSTPHQVGFVVTADEGFSMSFKFNDHLGSTVISDTYSTFGEAGLVDKAFAAGNMLLLPSGQDEVVYLGAYGDRLDQNNVSSEQARYTDHEYDQETGFNYMKGRYQFPMYAKFNRPDPMRDWNWLRPHTLNLYEYVGNDPINAWDPTGLEVISIDLRDDEQQQLLEEFSYFTGYSIEFTTNEDGTTQAQGLYFDENGKLNLAEGAVAEGGSETAAAFLAEIIGSENLITLNNAVEPGKIAYARANQHYFGEVQIDFGDISTPGAAEYKNVPEKAFGLGTNVFHEMYHAHTGKQDRPNGIATEPSPVVDFVNIIRDEMGIPLRQPDRYAGYGTERKYHYNFFEKRKNGKLKKNGKVKFNGKLLKPKFKW